jgi:hypothetical protein
MIIQNLITNLGAKKIHISYNVIFIKLMIIMSKDKNFYFSCKLCVTIDSNTPPLVSFITSCFLALVLGDYKAFKSYV